MAGFSVNTLNSLNGNFKKVYADDLVKLIPQSVKIWYEMDFIPADKQGGLNYNVPVVLQNEHGITYGGGDGEAFALNAPVAGTIKQASVQGVEMVLRSMISYGAASRAEKSEAAFVRTTKHVVSSMKESMDKKLEAQGLYGQYGLGKVDAAAASTTVTIQDAEFAPGLWTGAEGMRIEFYNGASKEGEACITGVSIENKQLTLDTAVTVTAGADIFEKGAKNKEFAGIHKVLTNSSTLFGIDAAQYNLWKSFEYDVAGAFSFNKIQLGLAGAAGKGLDEDIDLYISNDSFAKLANDQASLRRHDSSYKPEEGKVGNKALTFYGQTGDIRIHPHSMVKEGYAYGLTLDNWEKVGSSDVTFRIPGSDEEFFRHLSDHAGYELRCYADVAIICHKPNKQILFKGISN